MESTITRKSTRKDYANYSKRISWIKKEKKTRRVGLIRSVPKTEKNHKRQGKDFTKVPRTKKPKGHTGNINNKKCLPKG